MQSRPPPAELRPELVLAILTPAEREVVAGWLATLGFEASDWLHVPHMRPLIELVAVLRASAAYADCSDAETRIRWAAEDLGMEDDPDARAHPAEKIVRKFYDWHARVRKVSDGRADDAVECA